LLIQAVFLALSLSVFFGVIGDQRVIAFYNALHLFPILSQLPWMMLAPFAGVTAGLIILSLVFGRLYCSFLCPVGFIQDLFRKLGRALGLSGRPAAGWTSLRFFILALCLTLAALRSSAYLYFDHFSNLGRVYGLARTPFGFNGALGLIFLATILVSLRWPRWFCAVICPSGTMFMLAQVAAFGKVRFFGCRGQCGRCSQACPVMCISDGGIDEKLCINCLECVSACGQRALAFSFRWPGKPRAVGTESAPSGLSRRQFMAAAGLAAAGAAAGFFVKRRLLRPGAADAVVPPGGKAFDSFLERCTACAACVSVCPTRVLAPAGREAGFSGAAKVRLDFNRSYCAYECNACLAVCPSGAISYFPLETKKRIRIGRARLIKADCIPYAFERDCGACQEACPTSAITMEPFRSVYAPVWHEETCIGCGACQFACPARPRKAIWVEPVDIHSFAAAPPAGRQPAAASRPAEFPF